MEKISNKCLLCNNNKYIYLFPIKNYKLIKCIKCGLIRIDPFPKDKLLENYYKNFDYSDGFINEALIRRDSIRILHQLKKLKVNSGVILDIGCGAGFFLDEARKRDWRVLGIDTSYKAIQYARDTLKLDVIRDDFIRYKFTGKKFDVIIFSQLIEHLKNPTVFLDKIFTLLNLNGIIVIVTPNIKSYLAQVLKDKFNYLIPPEHIYYYSPLTLSCLIKNCGYRILKLKTYGYSTDLATITKSLFGKQKAEQSRNIINEKVVQHNKSLIKQFKSLIFDKILCVVFYPLLNVNLGGSMVEVYARKEE